MSASLIVLIPLVLLGVVTTLCFVGCAQVIGLEPWQDPPSPPSPYQSAVSGHPDIVACWPLADQTESPDPTGTPAVDITTNKINLSYTAPTAGSVKLRQTQIVPGDSGSACALFNGGFAQIGFDSRLNPSGSFSIEAWVQPEWKLTDTGVIRVVVASNDPTNPNNLTGYQLHATAENHWAASVGTGSKFVIAKPDPGDPPTVKPGEANYLVATFDAVTGTLQLYVNGSPSAQATIPMGTSFVAATGSIPFAIAILAPPPGTDMGPQSPFNGEIQDVAFYKAVLIQGTINSHFNLGSA